ncbi:uncharacterized protein B0H64DRAFT_247931 [Chaetomium fimeti]|uniref:Meiotic recombination protein DMC1 n=1 Tax=Chaetomium fimeti TaxID=1854472 RepID=A0AAE0H7T1_9PEZI|nr:hypothetical protein B0H64DRAFT_247931 [Chaetomium fimeti]
MVEQMTLTPSPSPAPATSPPATSAAWDRPQRPDLPHPRSRPFRPGSAKENLARNFISDTMADINRWFVKRAGAARSDNDPGYQPGDDEGYKSIDGLCRDLDPVIHLIWRSGTPSLQIPSLLSIASEFNTWMLGFPPSPDHIFPLLRKLDHCFASLLSGEDIVTHEPLPGFENGLRSGMSPTDMVRCRSTALNARTVVIAVLAKMERGEAGDDEGESGVDNDDGDDNERDVEADYMDAAQVYEYTLVKLGETVGGSGVADVPMFAS